MTQDKHYRIMTYVKIFCLLLISFSLSAQTVDQYKTTTAAGSVNAYTIPNSDFGAYRTNEKWLIDFTGVTTNSGACTLNRFGLGAVSIKMPDGTNPTAGVLTGRVQLSYNGTYFYVVGGAGSSSAGTVTSITFTSPLTGGTITSTGTVGIGNSIADGTTKGASSFETNDFNSTLGNISIDYTNGQAASNSVNGFLSSSDHTNYNTAYNRSVTGLTFSSSTFTFTKQDATTLTASVPTFNQNTTGSAATLTTPRTIGTVTGDATSAGSSFDGSANNTNALTLATVNSNVGTFGSTTKSNTITVNGKGLITAISEQTLTPAVGSITGLASGITTWLATPSSANLSSAITDETGTVSLVFSTSPTLITPILGVASSTSETITGTGGNGFIELLTQSTNPSAPSSGTRIFSNSNSKFSWRGSANTFVKTFDGAAATADRVYSLPDFTGNVLVDGGNNILSASTTITANTGSFINIGGAWTATANNQANVISGGSLISRNINNDFLFGYLDNPTLTVNAGAPTGQTLYGRRIDPTFSGTATKYALGLTNNLEIKTATAISEAVFINSSATNYTVGLNGATNFIIQNNSTGYGIQLMSSTFDINASGNLMLRSQANTANQFFIGDQTTSATTARIGATFVGMVSHGITAYTPTTGTAGLLQIGASNGNANFQPTSGTATYTVLSIKDLINQTGTASGAITYFDINPTRTGVLGTEYGVLVRPTATLSGFGTATPVSNLEIAGSLGSAITTSTGSLTLDATHHTIIITSGTGTYTLPSASAATRRQYIIINQTGSGITVSSYKDKTGSSATTIAANAALKIQSDGSNWYQIN